MAHVSNVLNIQEHKTMEEIVLKINAKLLKNYCETEDVRIVNLTPSKLKTKKIAQCNFVKRPKDMMNLVHVLIVKLIQWAHFHLRQKHIANAHLKNAMTDKNLL